jgi:hypothetical protein
MAFQVTLSIGLMMAYKRLAITLASFGLMAQIAPDEPDGTMGDIACRRIAYYCVTNYASLGYGNSGECFDAMTGTDCIPPVPDPIHRVWAYYEGPINRCTSPCYY